MNLIERKKEKEGQKEEQKEAQTEDRARMRQLIRPQKNLILNKEAIGR